MNGSGAAATRLRFGEFELDVRSGELSEGQATVLLQEQPRRLLIALLARPGDVVTRAELQALLWPGGTHVDFELGLNAAIRRLRHLLRDSAEKPRFVETLPRRGYRFIAAVGPACAARQAGRYAVAVLPFDSLSTDPEDQILADGITEDLVTQLAKHDVHVVSRTLVAEWRASALTLEQIGRSRDVCMLVEGSVRRTGDGVRVTSRLVDSRSGEHVWGESFERAVDDIPMVQAEVCVRVAAALHAKLRCSGSSLVGRSEPVPAVAPAEALAAAEAAAPPLPAE